MDLIARDSESASLVAREESEPYWYPEATAPAARAQVWKLNAGNPVSSAELLGVYELGPTFEIEFNPTMDRNVLFAVISLSADGTPCVSRLEDAVWATLPFERETVPVLGIEEHVPTVTKPPVVAKIEGLEEWSVLTPAPDAFGGTTKVGQIKIEKADDVAVFETWDIPLAGQHRIPMKAYPCKLYYRWQNQADEDAGGGRGWSDWSPSADGAEAGAAAPPPPPAEVLATYEFDADDGLAPQKREVLP